VRCSSADGNAILQLRQVNRDEASNVSPDVLCNTVVAMANEGVVVKDQVALQIVGAFHKLDHKD
jgi:hypothetical protein